MHLKEVFLLVVSACLVVSCAGLEQNVVDTINFPERIPDYVDPFIGTGGHGHTYPGATTPFGMVQCSPQTRLTGWDGSSGYHYTDSQFYGVAHTSLSGTGISDYGDVLLLPYLRSEELTRNENGQAFSGFNKADESASIAFYSVLLDSDIEVSLTATPRVGIHQYLYPGDSDPALLLDLKHRDHVIAHAYQVLNDSTVLGKRISSGWAKEQHIYFAIRFSSPISDYTFEEDSLILKLHFSDLIGNMLISKVALSAVSARGALQNLEYETAGKSFDQILKESRQMWQKELGKVRIQSESIEKATVFYSALYHTLLTPNLYSDVDGKYRGMDLGIHELAENRSQYTVFSLWDTYRSTHPLYTLLQPARNTEFIQTLLDQYQKGGILPIWELSGNYTGTMIGYHAIPVIWDAYQKGDRGFDAELALEAMKHSAEQDHRGLKYYKQSGFIPADEEGESTSKTLEYAYDDWCIAQMARALGKNEDYNHYRRRSQQWINVYDPSTRFMRARQNGGWFSPFDPHEVNFNYTEANAWQYRFFVPHDLETLIARLGGGDAFALALDELFAASSETSGRDQADITGLLGQYAHGNEPSHHLAYLYNYVGKAWKTQEKVQEIMNTLYSGHPDGLSGNEDCGQMSSWLVLSALGFYPVTPGDGTYAIGSPWFQKAVIITGEETQFHITAIGKSERDIYIQSTELNGQPYQNTYLLHADIKAGGSINFTMGDKPNTGYGSDLPNRPRSRVEGTYLAPPYVVNTATSFTDSIDLAIESYDPQSVIHYQVFFDDQMADQSSAAIRIYSNPIPLSQSGRILFWNVSGKFGSPKISTRFNKIPVGRTITLFIDGEPATEEMPYANQYSAGGQWALIDGVKGRGDFKTGSWQGYEGKDLHAIVDLGEVQEIHSLEITFLQDENSWIFMPDSVVFEVSLDGESYSPVGDYAPITSKHSSGSITELFQSNIRAVKARYVRVVGRNIANCPDWHKSAGGDCWIFADEIVIR